MSDTGAALSLYHLMLVIVGVPLLAATSRGLFTGLAWWCLVGLAIPILAVHVLVMPSHLSAWPYQWATLAFHALVAAPMGVSLFLSIQRAWDALGRCLGARISLAAGSAGGVGALLVVSPGVDGASVVASLVVVSFLGGLGANFELG